MSTVVNYNNKFIQYQDSFFKVDTIIDLFDFYASDEFYNVIISFIEELNKRKSIKDMNLIEFFDSIKLFCNIKLNDTFIRTENLIFDTLINRVEILYGDNILIPLSPTYTEVLFFQREMKIIKDYFYTKDAINFTNTQKIENDLTKKNFLETEYIFLKYITELNNIKDSFILTRYSM
jgi:hypothetical protein